MSRLLIHKTARKANPQEDTNEIGDIVDHQPTGFSWGTNIDNNTGFLQLEVTGLPIKEFTMPNQPEFNPVNLSMPLVEQVGDDFNIIKERRFKVERGLSGVNVSDSVATIEAAALVISDKVVPIPGQSRMQFNVSTQEFEML